MGTMRSAAVATLLALARTAVCRVVLLEDNLRTRYREEPALFTAVWDQPALLSGNVSVTPASTDLALHSENRTQLESWVDYLYPFGWETEFAGAYLSSRCRVWWWASYVASSLYLIGLWVGTSSMKDRPAFKLDTILAVWNLLLAVFSFIGMVRTVPHLIMVFSNYGFEYTVCRAALVSYGSGASGLWVALFIFSKYAELLDTVFLVLRKRNVSFLHWYHHCSVLLYCWHAYVWEMPTGIYFVAMNYTVHAMMYSYYFLALVCAKPPSWALLVTIMQLAQMAVGIIITVTHLRILIADSVTNCDGHIPNLAAALGMYASYFILFAQFLFQRYCQKRPEKRSKKAD